MRCLACGIHTANRSGLCQPCREDQEQEERYERELHDAREIKDGLDNDADDVVK